MVSELGSVERLASRSASGPQRRPQRSTLPEELSYAMAQIRGTNNLARSRSLTAMKRQLRADWLWLRRSERRTE